MNRTRLKYSICAIALLWIAVGCSTKKNSWTTRKYHETTARFNVHFNGNEAYLAGLKKIKDGTKDDYSQVLPLFYYTNHELLKSTSADMDRAIEKSKKTIKTHSIKKKPQRSTKKARDSKYQAWYNQEEFNPMVVTAYLLMGKANFHKGEFLESIGIFNYVIKHFPNHQERYLASLWQVRAYLELGWLYEAEDLLNKLNNNKFPENLTGEFAVVKADLALKMNDDKNAIPLLITAIDKEKNRDTKRRYMFILAQLYQNNKDFEMASKYYQNVIKLNPPYDMVFNARMRLTVTSAGSADQKSIAKSIRKMMKEEKNKEYLDQLYFALGTIEENNGNTKKAIENYNLSIENSTTNTFQKAQTLLTLGDIYYKAKDYRTAQPNYSQAITLLGENHPSYKKYNQISLVLTDLATNLETISREDSLQTIAKMPEKEQLKRIETIIANKQKQEKLDQEKALQKAKENKSTNAGTALTGNFYFYNAQLVDQGIKSFKKSWGNRKLEDNWRRATKQEGQNFANDTETATTEEQQESQAAKEVKPEDDNNKPEFYLKNIPKNDSDFVKSNQQLETAYFGAATTFSTALKEYNPAIEHFIALNKRFPDNKNYIDALYGLYLAYNYTNQKDKANEIKQQIVTKSPNSKYAIVLTNPNYASDLSKADAIQDSLYTATYRGFLNGDFKMAIANCEYAKNNYPDSKLIPNFMFVGALAVGKTGTTEQFVAQLTEVKTKYPQSDIAMQADAILARIITGLEPVKGEMSASLLLANNQADIDKAVTKTAPPTKETFTFDSNAKHYFILIYDEKTIDKNKFLFEISKFNFDKFLYYDFDISFSKFGFGKIMLVVNGFNKLDEALWYQNRMSNDDGFKAFLKEIEFKQFAISDENFRSLLTIRNIDVYEEFYLEKIKKLESEIQNKFKAE